MFRVLLALSILLSSNLAIKADEISNQNLESLEFTANTKKAIKKISPKAEARAKQRFIATYVVESSSINQDLTIDIFNIEALENGVVAIDYDIYIGRGLNLNNILYTTQTGFATVKGKNLFFNFVVPIQTDTLLLSAGIGTKKTGGGTLFATSNLDCSGSNPNLSCELQGGAIGQGFGSFTINAIDPVSGTNL